MESNSNKDMIWDTTQNYYHYPHFIKKEFLNYYVNCERKYHKWLENISINYHKDIDWWASSPINRNPYSSDLYKSICIILTIKKLIKKKKITNINLR